ncbi:hypothetical protein W5A_01390 [Imtechella halotolerans K1]|uniref:Uncharacterized protein n=3 Tax=Imtechella TaxID=1165076 RepID=I0WJR9_9FLAO|nr:hypothetical protein W5A_01390 [Imtechella halotolerans K1]
MLFNALRMPVTYLYYELDPDGFIALLCENKDTPELECEGKCELKKVAESSTNNSKEPAKSIHYKEIQLFVESIPEFYFHNSSIDPKTSIKYSNLYTFAAINNCFHPPKI